MKQKSSEIAEPPICLNCQHFFRENETGFRCRAFPGGVPMAIIASVADHRKPYKNDGGIHYEPIKDDFQLPSNLGIGRLPGGNVVL